MSNLTILALGDLHIQPDNLADIKIYLNQLKKFLEERKDFDLIVIMGDTLHTHELVYSQCLNMMLEYIWLCQAHAPTYILIGNHELVNNGEFLNDQHPFVGWKKTYNIVDRVIHMEIKDKHLLLSPYVPDGRFVEALKTNSFDFRKADCIFGHQLLDGAKMGAIKAKGIEEWKKEYPMLISGHIHDQQDPQPNLHYTGSSIQVAFGEQEDHTASVITIRDIESGSKITIEKVNLHPPTKRTIYLDIGKVRSTEIKQDENTMVKLSISGDSEDFKTFKKTQQYKDYLSKGIKVVFKQKKKYQPELPSTNQKTFPNILFELIEKDPHLVSLYQQIFVGLEKPHENIEIVLEPEIIFEN